MDIGKNRLGKQFDPVESESIFETMAELQCKVEQQSSDLLNLQVEATSIFLELATKCGPEMDLETFNIISSCKSCHQYYEEVVARTDGLEQRFKADINNTKIALKDDEAEQEGRFTPKVNSEKIAETMDIIVVEPEQVHHHEVLGSCSGRQKLDSDDMNKI